jgi:hypothetical protein
LDGQVEQNLTSKPPAHKLEKWLRHSKHIYQVVTDATAAYTVEHTWQIMMTLYQSPSRGAKDVLTSSILL